MGKIVHLPDEKKQDVIVVGKNNITINGVECQTMDLEEFLMSRDISPEEEERFIKELFIIIRDYIIADWKIMKIFREVFRGKVK